MNSHVQKMLEDAIKSEGVEEVFSTDAEINSEAVDLFGDDYLLEIYRIKLPNTRVKYCKDTIKHKCS